ncbi:MAG TPA: hypothetical protein VF792_10270 [Ktedonobacterales bacterium]
MKNAQQKTSTAPAAEATPASPAIPRRAALNETKVWQVYARQKYDEPLHEIGAIVADDVELAKVYARSIYDEFAWIEMAIIPRDTIVTVIAS